MARPFYSAPVGHHGGPAPPPVGIRPPPPQLPPPPPGFTSDKPWMTPQLVAEIRRRNFLQNRAARSGAEQDRAVAEQQRQLVSRLVAEAKERFCLAYPERTDEVLASDRRARPFHCGSCDRSYGTQQQLDEHLGQHVRCGLDDCPFTAHPRVVEKHVTMQHQTGLAKVIMALNTPEAIARWREQRRANFCRPESAARRQAEQAERAARGIRLSAQGGRFPPTRERPGRGRGRGRGRDRGRGRGARHRPPVQPASDSDEEVPRRLAVFAGILTDLNGDGGDSDTEGGDDSCTEEGGPHPTETAVAPVNPPCATDSAQGGEEASLPAAAEGGTSADGGSTDTIQVPTDRRPSAAGPARVAGGTRGRGGRGRGGAGQPPRKRRRPLTLLEKLLAPDIRRERNIILQCVRHVVNANFFEDRPANGAPAVEDGRLETTNGALDVEEGRRQTADGAPTVEDGRREMKDGAPAVAEGRHEATNGAPTVEEGRRETADGALDVEEGRHEATNGAPTVEEGRRETADGAPIVEEGRRETADGVPAVEEGPWETKDGAPAVAEGRREAADGAPAWEEGRRETVEGAPPPVDAAPPSSPAEQSVPRLLSGIYYDSDEE